MIVIKKQKLFVIPEEPPLNEHGLVIPPAPVRCTDITNPESGHDHCFEDRHHIYWQAELYQTRVLKGLRTSSRFIIKMCRQAHDEIHAFQLPPPKPPIEVARLAIQQADIDQRINAKYESITKKRSDLVKDTTKKPKKIEASINRLLDEIDELKEQKSLIFGNAGGVLPTTQYRIVYRDDLDYEQIKSSTEI